MIFFSERMRADGRMQQLDTILDDFTPPMTMSIHSEIMYLLEDLESIWSKMKEYFYPCIDSITNSAPKPSSRDKEDYTVYKYYVRLGNTIEYIKGLLAYAQEYNWEVVKYGPNN